jgi:hypothetical protein
MRHGLPQKGKAQWLLSASYLCPQHFSIPNETVPSEQCSTGAAQKGNQIIDTTKAHCGHGADLNVHLCYCVCAMAALYGHHVLGPCAALTSMQQMQTQTKDCNLAAFYSVVLVTPKFLHV